MQLKAAIKKISKEKGISAQLVLQNYMMERFLERLACSVHKDHFILKGGFFDCFNGGFEHKSNNGY